MGKLKKLVHHPVQFFADALLRRRLAAEGRLLLERVNPLPVDLALSPEQIDSMEGLRNALVKCSPAFWVDAPGYPWDLDCFDLDVPALAGSAFLFSQATAATLEIKAAGKRHPVTVANLGALVKLVKSSRNFVLRFRSQTGRETSLRACVWERRDDTAMVHARSNNYYVKRIRYADFERAFDSERSILGLKRLLPSLPIDYPAFEVDVVYTWVNHQDPKWRALISQFRPPEEIEWCRYVSADELRYSMRSINDYAPWVRKIFLVTNCDPPQWLREDSDKVVVVPHEAIFPAREGYLPTFNSHSIEACLCEIPGLGEHFMYLNDDVFLGTTVPTEQFFTTNGCSVSQLEPYGMIYGDEPSPENPDYFNAAINGQKLLHARFGVSPTRSHFHSPQCLRKSVLREMATLWPEVFDQVRRSRFRALTDVSITSFLYHHYAYLTHQAVHGNAPSLLVRHTNYRRHFPDLLKRRGTSLFFCINDGEASADDDTFQRAKEVFLAKRFPTPAPWEHVPVL